MSERSSKRSRGSVTQDDAPSQETHEAKLRRQQMLNKAAQQRYRCVPAARARRARPDRAPPPRAVARRARGRAACSAASGTAASGAHAQPRGPRAPRARRPVRAAQPTLAGLVVPHATTRHPAAPAAPGRRQRRKERQHNIEASLENMHAHNAALQAQLMALQSALMAPAVPLPLALPAGALPLTAGDAGGGAVPLLLGDGGALPAFVATPVLQYPEAFAPAPAQAAWPPAAGDAAPAPMDTQPLGQAYAQPHPQPQQFQAAAKAEPLDRQGSEGLSGISRSGSPRYQHVGPGAAMAPVALPPPPATAAAAAAAAAAAPPAAERESSPALRAWAERAAALRAFVERAGLREAAAAGEPLGGDAAAELAALLPACVEACAAAADAAAAAAAAPPGAWGAPGEGGLPSDKQAWLQVRAGGATVPGRRAFDPRCLAVAAPPPRGAPAPTPAPTPA
jgi:hypothetical protein